MCVCVCVWALLLFADQRLAGHWETFPQFTVVALQQAKEFCRGRVFGLGAACEWDCYTRRPSTVDS